VDDIADGRLLEALPAWAGEGVVEVGADLPLRARVGERVAAPAALLEELLAVGGVGLALGDSARAAARREQRRGCKTRCSRERSH
jgi:hypothetical protein